MRIRGEKQDRKKKTCHVRDFRTEKISFVFPLSLMSDLLLLAQYIIDHIMEYRGPSRVLCEFLFCTFSLSLSLD